jgi:membrane protease YdiL (CAAX protease family)
MLRKIFHAGLTRIILGFVLVALIIGGMQFGSAALLEKVSLAKNLVDFFSNVLGMIAGFFCYKILYHYYERRTITELSGINAFENSLTGLILGVGLQSAVILTLFIMGYYSVEHVNNFSSLLMPFGIAITSGVSEEILFRGIIFRITEEKLGSVIALVISSALFGLIHLANENATFFSAVSIALQAGFLLGCSYVLTRKLWLPIFLHIGWNFAEGGIFGAAISGNATTSLVTSKISGPEIFTGGAFGPENSVFATLYCLAAGILILYIAVKKGNLIQPYWKMNSIQ